MGDTDSPCFTIRTSIFSILFWGSIIKLSIPALTSRSSLASPVTGMKDACCSHIFTNISA